MRQPGFALLLAIFSSRCSYQNATVKVVNKNLIFHTSAQSG